MFIVRLIAKVLHYHHYWKDANDETDDVIHVIEWEPFFLERGVVLFSWRGPL